MVYSRGLYWVQSCLISSLMIWVMGQRDTKLGGVADTPEGTSTGWRNALAEHHEAQREVPSPHLGRNNPRHERGI